MRDSPRPITAHRSVTWPPSSTPSCWDCDVNRGDDAVAISTKNTSHANYDNSATLVFCDVCGQFVWSTKVRGYMARQTTYVINQIIMLSLAQKWEVIIVLVQRFIQPPRWGWTMNTPKFQVHPKCRIVIFAFAGVDNWYYCYCWTYIYWLMQLSIGLLHVIITVFNNDYI